MGSGYDIIGDTHGYAAQHEELLAVLGYKDGVHPKRRKIIYLGDSINRGPEQIKNLKIHRDMINAGTARMIMGNHEFKAIMFWRQNKNGEYLRSHTDENVFDQRAFLEAFPFGSYEYREAIRFFETLPLYIRTKGFDVVHAYWDPRALSACRPFANASGVLGDASYEASEQDNHKRLKNAISLLTKGPVYSLPEGMSILNSKQEIKEKARIFWWRNGGAEDIASLADHGDQFAELLKPEDKETFLSLKSQFKRSSRKPLFIGHYNMLSQPDIEHPAVACLNYKDRIVAYRWNHGDKGLDPAKLVCV